MMTNQKGSSRLDAALKMLLIAFISLLAFSSGVFFGKQMSDSDYQLKALESDYKDQTKPADVGQRKDQHPEDALADGEVAALSDKLVNAEKSATREADGGKSKPEAKRGEKRGLASDKSAGANDKGQEAPAAKGNDEPKAARAAAAGEPGAKDAKKEGGKREAMKPAKSEGAKASAGPQKAAERVAMGASPSENSKPKAEPREPLLPSSIGSPKEGEFTVQVASYPESAEAKARAEDLAKKGFPAYPVEATVKGKTWYRVSIGSFRTAKEASTYRAQLMKQADLRSAIVQRIER